MGSKKLNIKERQNPLTFHYALSVCKERKRNNS